MNTLSARRYPVVPEGIAFNLQIATVTPSLTLRDDGGIPTRGRVRDPIPPGSCCLATLPVALIVYVLSAYCIERSFLLKYSRRFHICDTVTTPEVRIRRVFVWRLSESMGAEAMACMGEWLGTPEMF